MKNNYLHRVVEALHQAGSRYASASRYDLAEEEFRKALLIDKNNTRVRHALSVSLLAQGKYIEGFELYYRRTEVDALKIRTPRLNCKRWSGEDIKGKKIAIFPEQGLGDQIQFARFIPRLVEIGADVTAFFDPPVFRLFEKMSANIFPASGVVEFPDPDFWALIGDLPGNLRIDVENIPSTPYVSIESPNRNTSRGGIGLMRRGNPAHPNDIERSIPEDLSIPFKYIDLHPDKTGAKDFLQTASIISNLDLVISVDTSVAHLAGAMGKPCWIMLPYHQTDWRWMSERSDSPWYPSVRLYRQKVRGDWNNLISEVHSDIKAIATRL